MPIQIELTLEDLARIALGGPGFGPNNIAVLHGLIGFLLLKLDCRKEKVKIRGLDAKILKKMLKNSKINPYAFRADKLEIMQDKFNKITELEKRVEAVQTRLDRHFEDIVECNRADRETLDPENWVAYTGPCEDICAACEPENVIVCKLLKNADFMKKMFRRIAYPFVDQIFELETLVKKIHVEFKVFMERTSEHYLKTALVEQCVKEVKNLSVKVEDSHLQFLNAMQEVQDMLDAKVDRIHIPAMKRYVREHFNDFESKLNSVMEKKKCPKGGGIIMSGIRCLSCGNEAVCADKTIDIRGYMPEANAGSHKKVPQKYCGCKRQQPKFTKHHMPWNCPAISTEAKDYVLKEGRNKMIYRMDLAEESKEQEKAKCEGQHHEKMHH